MDTEAFELRNYCSKSPARYPLQWLFQDNLTAYSDTHAARELCFKIRLRYPPELRGLRFYVRQQLFALV